MYEVKEAFASPKPRNTSLLLLIAYFVVHATLWKATSLESGSSCAAIEAFTRHSSDWAFGWLMPHLCPAISQRSSFRYAFHTLEQIQYGGGWGCERLNVYFCPLMLTRLVKVVRCRSAPAEDFIRERSPSNEHDRYFLRSRHCSF